MRYDVNVGAKTKKLRNKVKSLLKKEYEDECMIAFDLSTKIRNNFEFPRGSKETKQQDMHLTLLYLGKVDKIEVDETKIIEKLSKFCKNYAPLKGSVQGIGRFWNATDDGMHPIWLSYDSIEIQKFRQELYKEISSIVPIIETYGFIPHITIGFIPEEEEFPLTSRSPVDIMLDEVILSWGSDNNTFKLGVR